MLSLAIAKCFLEKYGYKKIYLALIELAISKLSLYY